MTDLSQNGEAAVLLRHFGAKTDGRALDVGSWHSHVFSNTSALIERGWSAVLVEPSPKPFLGLLEAYRDNPRVRFANVAVAASAGLAPWYDAGGDAISTLSVDHRRKWESSGSAFREFAVATVTMGDLLDYYGRQWDLLSIDVEGSSAELLLRTAVEDLHALKAVICEHDDRQKELTSHMGARGFRLAAENQENVVYLR